VTRLLAVLWLGVVAFLALGLAAPAAAQAPDPAQAQPGDDPAPARFSYDGPVGTTLDDTDKVFLAKVRQAGMWEGPAGRQAQAKGKSARTREVGRLIEIDHANLDADVADIAARLGVTLPTQVTPDQEVWLAELDEAQGDAFDAAFAQLLRNAHGAVFQLIATIRADSRNDLVRAFAAHTNNVVHRHMTLLESTGNVNYAQLPVAKATMGRTRPYRQEPLFVAAMIAVAAVVGFTGVMRAVRSL
jgi:predicted outer membrane protein